MTKTNTTDTKPLQYGTHYAKGGRENLEDRVAARHITTAGGLPLIVAMVADGIGGHNAGEVAAQMTLDIVYDFLEKSTLSDPDQIPQALQRALTFANQAVYREALTDQSKQGMGTTGTVVVVHHHRLYLAHVGDSRAYLVRNGRAMQLTQDHTWGREMVKRGVLTEQEAADHPKADELFMSVGYDREVHVDLGLYIEGDETETAAVHHQGTLLQPGDRLILCSDGLIKEQIDTQKPFVSSKEIAQIVQRYPPDKAARKLVKKALSRTTDDNVSAIVLEMPGSKRKAAFLPRLFIFLLVILLLGGLGAGAYFLFPDLVNPLFQQVAALPVDQSTPTSPPPTQTVIPTATAFVQTPTSAGDTGLMWEFEVIQVGDLSIGQETVNADSNRLVVSPGQEIANHAGITEIMHPSLDFTLILSGSTMLKIESLSGIGDASETKIQIEGGTVLVDNKTVQPIVITERFGRSATVGHALAGIYYSTDPFQFQMNCFSVHSESDNDCTMLLSEESNPMVVAQGISQCVGQGCNAEESAIFYDEHTFLSPLIPSPTPTPTPTNTPTPTPTNTPRPTLEPTPTITPTQTPMPLTGSAMITITNPSSFTTLTGSEYNDARGTYSNIPPDLELWLLVFTDNNYFAQMSGPASLSANGTWIYGTIYFGSDTIGAGTYTLYAVLANEEAVAAFENQDPVTGLGPERPVPDWVTFYDSVRVTRSE